MGRKPVLLIGPIGLAIGMASFGLSRTYWPLVVSRCLQGVFNGNIGEKERPSVCPNLSKLVWIPGVSKSVMAEVLSTAH